MKDSKYVTTRRHFELKMHKKVLAA